MTEIRWYRWHINKYRGSGRTLGMSLAAHGAYRNLLDAYYLTGKLPRERKALWKLSLAESLAEYEAVADQVETMFSVSECGRYLIHDTADAELDEVTEKMEDTSGKRRAAANKRWGNANGCKSHATVMQTDAQESREEKNTEQSKKLERASRIPHDFKVTPDHRGFALEHDCPSPDDHIVKFREYWMGSGKTKKDWNATFRVWLLNERDKYSPKALGGANGGTRASQRQKSSFDAIAAAVDRANQRATGNGNGSHEGSLHQPGPAGGNAGRDDAGLESPDSGVRRKDVQASVIESTPTLQILPNHGRDKGVLRSGIERIPAPVGSG